MSGVSVGLEKDFDPGEWIVGWIRRILILEKGYLTQDQPIKVLKCIIGRKIGSNKLYNVFPFPLNQSIYLSTYLFSHPSNYLSTYRSIYYLSIYPFIYLSVYLSNNFYNFITLSINHDFSPLL